MALELQYILVYTFVDITCFLCALVMILQTGSTMGNHREIIYFRMMLVVFQLFIVADVLWIYSRFGYTGIDAHYTQVIENMTFVLAVTFMYYWFCFAQMRLKTRFVTEKKLQYLAITPVIAILVLYGTSPWTGWIYSLDEQNLFHPGPISWLPVALGGIYLYVATYRVLRNIRHEKSRARKRESYVMLSFIIAPTVASVVDMIIPGMPVMALSFLVSVFFVFINLQQSRINTDALTGLNNRRRAEEYIEDSLSSMKADNPLILFLIDVNYFKDINDQYGHNEGDRALQCVAGALRYVMMNRKGLAARWGGDEFIAATFMKEIGTAEDFSKEIQKALDFAAKEMELSYEIKASVGYCISGPDAHDLGAIFEKADESMYARKREVHGEGR